MKYVYLIMAAMSLVLFALMGIDKRAAIKGRWRVSERRLFALALLGGATGGTLGMFAFRHKTKHWYFRIGFPLLALGQTALCVYAAHFAAV